LKLLPIAHKKMKLVPDAEFEEKRKNLIMTLIIAYYNAGVECEYLHKYEEAESHYKNGTDCGRKYFGEKDEMTLTLKKSLEQVKRMNGNKSTQQH